MNLYVYGKKEICMTVLSYEKVTDIINEMFLYWSMAPPIIYSRRQFQILLLFQK